MSIHLLVAAAYLPKEVVNPTEKLALMKLADSADDDTRLATPTQRRMVAWVGVSEKRVSTIITSLVGKGLVARVNEAREGRAATYLVFPGGVPVTPDREDLDERLKGLRQRPANPRLARVPRAPRRRPRPPARTADDVEQRRAGGTTDTPGTGEQPPAVGSAKETLSPQGRVPPAKPSGFPQGNLQGFPGETPSLPPFRTSPPYLPPPTPAGSTPPQPAGCPAHGTPAASCRACGTSPRARIQVAQREQVEQSRDREAAEFRQWADEMADRRRTVAARADLVAEARRAAKRAAAESRAAAHRSNPDPHTPKNGPQLS